MNNKKTFQDILLFLEEFAKNLVAGLPEGEALKKTARIFEPKHSHGITGHFKGLIDNKLDQSSIQEVFLGYPDLVEDDLFIFYFIDTINTMLGEGLIWTGERLLDILPWFNNNTVTSQMAIYWRYPAPDLAVNPVSPQALETMLVLHQLLITKVWGLIYLMSQGDLGTLSVGELLERESFLDDIVSGIMLRYVTIHSTEIYKRKLERVSDVLPASVPNFYWDPECHAYTNLKDVEWKWYNRLNLAPIKKIHICPNCGRTWKLLRGV